MTPETAGSPADAPAIPLPTDDELPAEVRDAIANLPALNIFRMLGRLPQSFRPFLQLGGSLLGWHVGRPTGLLPRRRAGRRDLCDARG